MTTIDPFKSSEVIGNCSTADYFFTTAAPAYVKAREAWIAEHGGDDLLVPCSKAELEADPDTKERHPRVSELEQGCRVPLIVSPGPGITGVHPTRGLIVCGDSITNVARGENEVMHDMLLTGDEKGAPDRAMNLRETLGGLRMNFTTGNGESMLEETIDFTAEMDALGALSTWLSRCRSIMPSGAFEKDHTVPSMTPEDHFAETLVVQAAMECFIPNWLRATAMGENNILPPNGPTEEASAYFVRCMGKAGNPEAATHQSELLRTNLNCNAHHGTCNASVFASTVAASAGSSGVTSMMALLPALQPVLHGGAAAYVAKQIDAAWEYFKAVPDDGKIGEYVTEILEKGGALYGAGHGFLKGEIEDPRSVKVRQDLQRLFPSSDYVTFCVKYWQEAIPALIAHLKKDGKTPGYRATNVDSWTYIAHIASGLFDKGMHDAPFLTFAQSRGLGWARTFLWHVIINGGKLIRGTELYMFDFPKSEN